MKPVVLITRLPSVAESGSPDFTALVKAQGYRALSDPLLSITPLPQTFETTPAALIATSAQAFQIEYPESWYQLPLFVMGDASRAAAQSAGFSIFHSSGGHFSTLLTLVEKMVPPEQKIIYLRGDVVRHDLSAMLPSHKVEEVIVYKAAPALSLSDETLSLLKNGEIEVVTLFSPRSGEIFQDLVTKAGLAEACRGIKLLCLSPAVLESVRALPWQDVRVSASASQHDMASALQDWTRPEIHD